METNRGRLVATGAFRVGIHVTAAGPGRLPRSTRFSVHIAGWKVKPTTHTASRTELPGIYLAFAVVIRWPAQYRTELWADRHHQ